MLDYPLGTLGTVPRVYENEDFMKKSTLSGVLHFLFIWRKKNDKIVSRAYDCYEGYYPALFTIHNQESGTVSYVSSVNTGTPSET